MKVLDYFDDTGMIGGDMGYTNAGKLIGQMVYYAMFSSMNDEEEP